MLVSRLVLGIMFALVAGSAWAGVPALPPTPSVGAGPQALMLEPRSPAQPPLSQPRAGFQVAGGFHLVSPAAAGTEPIAWMQLRGVNARRAAGANDAFFAQMKADNIKLLRVGTFGGTLVGDDGQIDMTMVAQIDATLAMARKYDMRVVLDPHTFPGFTDKYTTRPEDAFWTDESYHQTMIGAWEFLANRYKDAGDVIAGYDLLNEPNTPSLAPVDGPGNWPALATKLVDAIRRIDKVHTIIVHANGGKQKGKGFRTNIDGLQYLRAPYFTPADTSNLVYQVHMYEPKEFALKGEGTYPGEIGGAYWDKSKLRQTLQPVRDFQTQTGATIYVGEFAPNVRADNGVGYMSDLIDILEEYGWAWTFHSYSGNPDFDVTRNPVMYAALRRYWAKNPQNVVAKP